MRRVETPEGRSVRLLRIGEQVRHVLSEILQRGDVRDDTLQAISSASPKCACRPIFATRRCS